MDTFSKTAFLLPFGKFLALFQEIHVPAIQRDVANHVLNIDESHCQTIHRVARADSLDEIKKLLQTVIDRRIEEIKADDDAADCCEVLSEDSYEDEHVCMFRIIRFMSRIVLPAAPVRISVIQDEGNGAENVPIGEPLLEFNFDSCFYVEMTDIGEQIARVIGVDAIAPSRWSEVYF